MIAGTAGFRVGGGSEIEARDSCFLHLAMLATKSGSVG